MGSLCSIRCKLVDKGLVSNPVKYGRDVERHSKNLAVLLSKWIRFIGVYYTSEDPATMEPELAVSKAVVFEVSQEMILRFIVLQSMAGDFNRIISWSQHFFNFWVCT